MAQKKPGKARAKTSKATTATRSSAVAAANPSDDMAIMALVVSFTALCVVFAVVSYYQYGR